LDERCRAGKTTVLFAVALEAVRLYYGETIHDILSTGALFPKVVV